MAQDIIAILQGKVGPQVGADGAKFELRQDRLGALVIASRGGAYREAVARGNVYIQAVKSATVTATTDISPLPATTGRALVGVINPLGSGKNISILEIGIATVSGTPGGPFYIDVVPNCGVAASLAASSSPVNALSLQASGSAGRGLAAAVPAQAAVGTMLRPLGGLAAVATGAGIASIKEVIDGGIELPPNSLLAITAHATGTSQVISGYIMWEEIPLPV
ncbi:MAG: hypothetical protein V4641_13070 [Pseudomonadota bacterium]